MAPGSSNGGISGVDGLVRVVRIKTKDGEYLRPVHCLCPLEYTE